MDIALFQGWCCCVCVRSVIESFTTFFNILPAHELLLIILCFGPRTHSAFAFAVTTPQRLHLACSEELWNQGKLYHWISSMMKYSCHVLMGVRDWSDDSVVPFRSLDLYLVEYRSMTWFSMYVSSHFIRSEGDVENVCCCECFWLVFWYRYVHDWSCVEKCESHWSK